MTRRGWSSCGSEAGWASRPASRRAARAALAVRAGRGLSPVRAPSRTSRARSSPVPRHAPVSEGLPRRQGVVGVADDPEVVDRLAAPARPRDDVVELQPVRRAADAARVERPRAAAAVARPDRAEDGGGDVLARASAAVAGFGEVRGRRLARRRGRAYGRTSLPDPSSRSGSGPSAVFGVAVASTWRGLFTSPRALACFSRRSSSAAFSTCSMLAPGMLCERPSLAASSIFRNCASTVMWSRRRSAVSGSTSSRRAASLAGWVRSEFVRTNRQGVDRTLRVPAGAVRDASSGADVLRLGHRPTGRRMASATGRSRHDLVAQRRRRPWAGRQRRPPAPPGGAAEEARAAPRPGSPRVRHLGQLHRRW